MNYLITGATSFLGQEVISTLAQSGAEVYAVCRDAGKLGASVREQCMPVEMEMSEYSSLDKRIDKADVFIHLAWAGTGHGGRDIVDIQLQNIRFTKEAMMAAHQIGCRLFVMAGSQAEYGATTAPQREEMECAPFSEYGKAKLQVQQECSRLADELGLKYMHLRIFSLFGESDHPWTLVMSCVDKMLRNEPIDLSPCTQNWNFLYVVDAAEQIMRLCAYVFDNNEFHCEVFNIASEDTRPLCEFVERMKELTKSKSELHYGAVDPAHVVSLQPDMSKTKQCIGQLCTYNFEMVIKRIIDNHNDKTI